MDSNQHSESESEQEEEQEEEGEEEEEEYDEKEDLESPEPESPVQYKMQEIDPVKIKQIVNERLEELKAEQETQIRYISQEVFLQQSSSLVDTMTKINLNLMEIDASIANLQTYINVIQNRIEKVEVANKE